MYAWAQLQPKLMHPPSPRQTPGRRAGPRPGAAREGRGRPEETDGPLPQLGEGPHNAGVGWPEPTDGGGGERGANTVLTPPPTAALKCWAKGGQAHPPKPDHPHPQATPSVDRKASLGPHEQGDLLRRAVLQRVVLGGRERWAAATHAEGGEIAQGWTATRRKTNKTQVRGIHFTYPLRNPVGEVLCMYEE